ncbi:hypothetical protein RDWZM_002920 [Blomia tropicalis]|uniref:acid phosphatase n=1 Tax=Blomia tropicalis TaxID=40697 RepID=A0A9Q0MIM4_BLOTA|nr:hypothetical protein RDWZM_002920 [Blomia tropicalis]
MYRIGKFLHEAYKDFLDNQTEPIEKYIYVRSSGSKRCLESTQMLTTALLFGENENQSFLKFDNNLTDYDYLSQYWHPIPIHSISPKGSDSMLDSITPCPNADLVVSEMSHKNENMKRIVEENFDFLEEISRYTGNKIDSLKSVYDLYQELFIESQYDYHWWKEPYSIWTSDYETYALSKLRELSRIYWSIQWNNKELQTLRTGLLIKQLNDNIQNQIDKKNRDKKIFIYSTHDTKIALLLHSMGIFNGFLIPAGATILFELHQDKSGSLDPIDDWFLRFYYFNETYTSDWAYQMVSDKICVHHQSQWSCPANYFMRQMEKLEPFDWKYQCGLLIQPFSFFAINLFILTTNFACLLGLFILLRLYSSKVRNRIPSHN